MHLSRNYHYRPRRTHFSAEEASACAIGSLPERASQNAKLRQLLIGISILVLLLGNLGLLKAQSPLAQYINAGIESNLSLQQKSLSVEKSRQALREAKGLFMPQVSFQASYSLAGGGRALEFPIGDLLNPVYATLNQLTGSEQFPTNLENVNEQFAPNNFQETKLRVVQPLFNSDIYFNYQAKQHLIGVENANMKAYEQELVKEIKTAYYGFLQTNAVLQIYDETEGLLKEILRVNQRLVENDKATRDAIYRAEYELSKLAQEVASAERQKQTAQAYLNFLLNRPLDTRLEVDSLLQPESEFLALAELENGALRRRAEIEQIDMAQAANLEAVALQKYSLLPQLNLVADVGFQGFGYNLSEQEYWLALVSLNWDLFQGFQRQARQQQAQIDQQMLGLQRQQIEQQIQLQVREAFFQMQASQKAVAAAQSGLKSARQAFRITQKKYAQDQASLLALLDTRTQFTTAQLSLTIATYDWLAKLAELEYATGGDF
ncbi:MAG: TolC family protein [Bacteroidota bacterium]